MIRVKIELLMPFSFSKSAFTISIVLIVKNCLPKKFTITYFENEEIFEKGIDLRERN